MNMSIREEVLNYLISTNLVENYIKKIALRCDLEMYDDVCQECWTQICEITEQKWVDLISQGSEKDKYTKCRAYISGVIHRNIRSENSKLYRLLKRYKNFEYLQDEIHWDNLKNTVHDEITDYLIMEIGEECKES